MCTSPTFEGVIALLNPEESWVAKWQRTSKFMPGLYATRVQGRLPDEIVDSLERRGVQYTPRDGSKQSE